MKQYVFLAKAFSVMVILGAFCLPLSAMAGETVPAKFMQSGESASAVASAIAGLAGCKVPLDFEEQDKAYPGIAGEADTYLSIVCEETDDGLTGGVGIGYGKYDEGGYFPKFFYSFP